uniref:L1 transposable element RRM domain-containing protein n=1 Tax=Oryzias latipes TaxID=8090 RepID=A0A3P9KMM2_ORYLA
MAEKLRKYKFDNSASKLARTARQRTIEDIEPESPARGEDIKAEILASLRDDISQIIREKLKSALSEDFEALKSELQAVRAEIASNASAVRAELASMETDMEDVKGGLSTWSDEVTALQSTVAELQSEITTLRDKCEDMEGRMRRCNIRIVGVAERPESSSPDEVSKMLRQALQLERDIRVDRSHRVPAPRKNGDERPRVIIAKLHYDGDAVDILKRAREKAPLTYNGKRISIFPDYTASVAKARAAFTDVRKALHGRSGVWFGLLYPARLRITYKNNSKDFCDPVKAMEYVEKEIITTHENETLMNP